MNNVVVQTMATRQKRIGHCKHNHVEVNRRQKLQTEVFFKNIGLNVFASDQIPHGSVYRA